MASEQGLFLHGKMMEDPAHSYSQAELEALLPVGARDQLIDFMQELMNTHMVKLESSGDALYYKPVSLDEADKIKNLSADEAMVYSHIQAAGRDGIWSKAIKNKTNLHQHVVMKCLKSLESSRHIKSVKSVKSPTRKIYMLFELQPSIEITGGPWFTDSELDSEFVGLLLRLVWQFIANHTFPTALKSPLPVEQESYGPHYEKYPSAEDIHEFVASSGVSTVDLGVGDIRSLCEVLVYDDKIEHTKDERYRATWSSVTADLGRQTPILPPNLRGFLALPPQLNLDAPLFE